MESCGPIVSTTEIALLIYATMLGTHPNSKLYSWLLPPCVPELNKDHQGTLSSVKLGKFSEWFNTTFDKEVAEVCIKSLKLFVEEFGTEIKDITLPELDELRIGHLTTLGSEYSSGLSGYNQKLRVTLRLECLYHSFLSNCHHDFEIMKLPMIPRMCWLLSDNASFNICI
ncbi:hypothetical protein M758_UG124600 [Ceratodon purpureus]|nr:hypothetical protein M758_UG124600 [Ceratodon purpureus]